MAAVNPRRNNELAVIAQETLTMLPGILLQLPNIQAHYSEVHTLETLASLRASDCPRRTLAGRTAIRVVNDDSFNAAISLASSRGKSKGRVAVLNMANPDFPGGGWLRGATAQEEALCYRSSLALSLHRRYYPWDQRMGMYSSDVVIIRSDVPSGHQLLCPAVQPADLPVVAVLSIAAIKNPRTQKVDSIGPDGPVQHRGYSDPGDRSLTKDKMRICLRMAARKGHGLLVLGALGCGAFRNPRVEVAKCWLEVLNESEFQGGWWDEIWFAIYDPRGEGTWAIVPPCLALDYLIWVHVLVKEK